MPRPDRKTIQLTIDGREVQASEGAMLVDAAKQGDIEIPYFCYEPKLGNPVGACRMCLVEVEGIPKLQTSCSTPVKDGMVVHTQTERVRHAQNAIVEFLLVNHPLDCPVCDKGGECPLQDITFGWGLGRSRFIEPKRHFEKPLALSPLVAIDRERCILCYRCVRFSQEIAEDYQLIFAERAAHTFVATHDGHPYVAPFSGNIIELCPVGALTSQPYRFRARPWDIESAAGICTLCPSQCNLTLTVRDDRVMRVLARDYEGNEHVDDGWLCDKGRFAYQAIHADERITRPLVRDGGELREVSWERALEAAAGLARHRGRVGALIGGQASNEEGFLIQRLMREQLDSSDIDSRGYGPHHQPIPAGLARALAAPELQASVLDVEYAHTVLLLGCDPREDASILDLRLRKGIRRHHLKVAVASARPTALDASAAAIARYAPGGESEFAVALDRALAGAEDVGDEVAALATLLRDGGQDVVIMFSERIGPVAAAAVRRIAGRLGMADRAGSGLLQIPAGANGRGLREAGAVPDAGPGYESLERPGREAAEIGAAAAAGEITALYLFGADPVRDLPNRALWERALHSAALVVAHASLLTEGLREHATVIFPAESYAEKEGTVTHPDGRLQRLRIAISHPGSVQAGWSVIAELARRCGRELQVERSVDAFHQLAGSVPVYEGLSLEEIGGRGLRWQERPQARLMALSTNPPADEPPEPAATPAPSAHGERPSSLGALALGTYRPLWASPEVEVSPALKFLVPDQAVELSPEDSERLGIADGEQVLVAQVDGSPAAHSGEAGRRAGGNGEGTRLHARAVIRSAVPAGRAFLAEGLPVESANVLTEPLIEVIKL
jgi:NADH-quinone oxidoreductase subunit G